MFEIHETFERVLMKSLMEIKQSSNIVNVKLIQNNIMIKINSVIG
jgi:hypothetical protein